MELFTPIRIGANALSEIGPVSYQKSLFFA
jgi:hypothetical protein